MMNAHMFELLKDRIRNDKVRNPFYYVADLLGVNCADRTDAVIAEKMLEQLSHAWMQHESLAYNHYKDRFGRDVYQRVTEEIPYDDGDVDDAEHLPCLCVTAYDSDGDECELSIPIRHCPMCGRRLPTSFEKGN